MTEFKVLENSNLKIILLKEGWELIKALQKEEKSDEDIFFELIEDQLCNGYHLIAPEDIGALTSSIIIGDSVVDSTTTKGDIDKINYWWNPGYQIESEITTLLREGEITFYK